MTLGISLEFYISSRCTARCMGVSIGCHPCWKGSSRSLCIQGFRRYIDLIIPRQNAQFFVDSEVAEKRNISESFKYTSAFQILFEINGPAPTVIELYLDEVVTAIGG